MMPEAGIRFLAALELTDVSISRQPFKAQWRQIVTFQSVQCHPGLTYILNFSYSGMLAPRVPKCHKLKIVD